MENPLVSVVMPVYNAEQFLSEAINSIQNQSFSNFEFIIINDGSTDNTENIVHSFMDDRIIYIKNDTNLNISNSLNKGISIAKGEFIANSAYTPGMAGNSIAEFNLDNLLTLINDMFERNLILSDSAVI